MSAEVPKQGGFVRFLRGLREGMSVEPKTAQQLSMATPAASEIPSAPRIVTPPSGLEEFTTLVRKGEDNYFKERGQIDLERQQEASRWLAARAAEEEVVTQKQKKIEEQEQARIVEAMDILNSFRVPEKLTYIKDAIWEGKGEIRTINSLFGRVTTYMDPYSGNPPSFRDVHIDRLGGIELVHKYYSFTQRDETVSYGVGRWMFEPATYTTNFSIAVQNIRIDSGKVQQVLRLSSEAYENGTPFKREILNAIVPVDKKDIRTLLTLLRAEESVGRNSRSSQGVHNREIALLEEELANRDKVTSPFVEWAIVLPIERNDSETLLIAAIAQETANRRIKKSLPTQLEQEASQTLAKVKQGPHWLKWETYGFTYSD